jgi:protein archease
MPYALIDHTADIGIRVSAERVEALFEEAACAIADILGGRSTVGDEKISIELQGIDRVDLLVRWLQEILFHIEVRGLRLMSAAIHKLDDTKVLGVVHGAYTDTPLSTEIKAVTYHNLDIICIDNVYVTTIILDR